MRPTHVLLAFVVGALAVPACGGAIAPSTDGGQGAVTGSSGGASSEPPSSTLDAGTTSQVSPPATCTIIPAGSGSPGSGAPELVASLSEPAGIAIDGQYAYVASYEVGPLYRVSLKDGSTTTLESLGVTNVAINSTTVFSVGFPDINSEDNGLVVSCAKTGCGGSYTTLASGQSLLWGVAADETSVYWTNQGGSGSGLFKAPVGGGAPTTLAAAVNADSIAVSGGRVFYVATKGQTGDSGLYSVSIDGGAVTEVLPPPADGSVAAIAVDCASVYYSLTDGTVGKVPIAGGPPVVLATGARDVLQIAVDAANLYFGDATGIAYVPTGGGAVTTIPGTSWYTGLAVDGSFIYWTPTEGGLMRMAK
ncbi:MAG TPA: hypothetical protein VIF09_19820 [Polyangiaceae bacterium]